MSYIVRFLKYSIVTTFLCANAYGTEPQCPNGSSPTPDVLLCEGFEDTDLNTNGSISEKYYDYDNDQGDMSRINTESIEGQYSLRTIWQTGETDAGSFQIHFGRNPLGKTINDTVDYREIFWRFYIKLQANFSGYPSKLTRLTSFANSNWAQSMAAHIWADDNDRSYFVIDPASGINGQNQLATTQWNDFSNLTWLGAKKGITSIAPGQWYCMEGHVKLNDPDMTNGVFELWIDDVLQASIQNLNWVGSWSDYGINTIMFSNYWGEGSPKQQERYLDAIVVSKSRINCLAGQSSELLPKPPVIY